ncbi:MAG TPA: type 1 glutamine amidotransferase, partial [Pontiella sp.]
DYPWLKAEKELIIQAVHAGKTILGVCLGAQLIADALGAKVYSGPHKEIGWFPIQCFNSDLIWPENQLTVFHWHGDTFDLPKGAKRIASSAACKNQAFIVKDRILGLQFHMETTLEGIETLIENCGHELVEAPFIQTPKEMRSGAVNIKSINCALEHLLDSLPR